ncbi:hypothetical protein V6N13_065619 [Hibiscus sabdariffa]
MVAAAVSATVKTKQLGGGLPLHQSVSRPPLLRSDPENAITPRRQKSGKFTSRYLSTSSSNSVSPPTKQCPPPLVSTRTSHSKAITTTKHTTPSAIKRSQAVERRHAVTPLPNNSMDLKTGDANNNSNNCDLSVSSQGEPFSYQCRKAKPAPSPCAARQGTPERRKPTVETTPRKGTEEAGISKAERWPAKLRLPNSVTSRSVGCTDERKRLNRSVNSNVVRALQQSMTDNRDLTVVTPVKSKPQCDLATSDTGSASSGSTSGAPESSSGDGDIKPRGIVVSARSWQETANRLCRSDPGYLVPKKNTAHSKQIVRDKYGTDSPLSSPKGVLNSRGLFHWPIRPASPSKLGLGDNLVNRSSILSLVGEAFKIEENKVSDAHLLRLLHNHLLQWRFVNARADATLSAKKSNTEKSLYNVWTTTSKLRESVRTKRNELQFLRQNLKLISILKGQMIFLDEWTVLDHDYCSYLSGAIEALTASTLRLPVVCGARVAKVNTLVAELRNLSTNELALLHRCKQVLPAIAAMRVKFYYVLFHSMKPAYIKLVSQLMGSLITR